MFSVFYLTNAGQQHVNAETDERRRWNLYDELDGVEKTRT